MPAASGVRSVVWCDRANGHEAAQDGATLSQVQLCTLWHNSTLWWERGNWSAIQLASSSRSCWLSGCYPLSWFQSEGRTYCSMEIIDTVYRYQIRYHIQIQDQIPYTEQMLSILVSHQPLVDVLVLNGSVKEFLFITHSRGRHFVWILWRLSVGFNQISWSQCASAWQVAVSFSVASLALRLMMFKSMVWEMTGWGLELMHEPILTAK